MRTFSLKNLFLILIAGSLLACVKEDPEKSDSTAFSKQYTRAYGDKSPKVIAIIETNDTDPRNVLSYHLGTSNYDPLFFDIVEFFAANIHKDANNDPTIYFNPELAPLLADTATYVKPLKDAGLKVVLSILGDWQGIGVANMTESQADKFTDILVHIVKTYGLDGVSFDDEYANYNYSNLIDSSYSRIIEQLRTKLDAEFPDTHKLIGVDQWGNYNQIDAEAGAMIDYVYHGTFGPNVFIASPSVSGVTHDRFSPQTIDLYNQYVTPFLILIKNRSAQAANQGYNFITTYDLRVATDCNPLPVLQSIAEGAYNSTVIYDGTAYEQDWVFVPEGHEITHEDVLNSNPNPDPDPDPEPEPEPEPEPGIEFPSIPNVDHGNRTPLNMTTVYVKTTNPLNAKSYYLTDTISNSSEPFLDLCVLDAGKIHKSSDNMPTLYLDSDMNHVLTNADTYIRPLQEKGIKVLLRILGDGQDMGVANMNDNQADAFTDILVWVVGSYGLNGITFDDQYSEYSSMVYNSYSNIILKLREKFDTYFPDENRLITVRQWGNYNQISALAGAALDYADHGTYGPNIFMSSSSISGVTNDRWSPQALKISYNYNTLILYQVRIRSMQASQGDYGVISTDDMRSEDDINPLNVFVKIAEGAFQKTATYDGNNYAKNWISSGSQTVSHNDCDLP